MPEEHHVKKRGSGEDAILKELLDKELYRRDVLKLGTVAAVTVASGKLTGCGSGNSMAGGGLHADPNGTPGLASNAHNYKPGMGVSVNPQTGLLELIYGNATIPGVVESMSLKLKMSFSGVSDTQILGLPQGWAFNLSYIVPTEDGTARDLLLNSSNRYRLDKDWQSNTGKKDKEGKWIYYKSGLRYYNLQNMQMTDTASAPQTLSYDTSQTYSYLLSKQDGSKQYFDGDGMMICRDDRFGNHILFYYNKTYSPATVETAVLTKIVDSYGQTTTFDTVSGKVITGITLPDGRKITYGLSDGNIVEITDPLGRKLQVSYDNAERPARLTFPDGAVTEINYRDDAFNTGGNPLPGVESIFRKPLGDSTPDVSILKTSYAYQVDSDNNFLGYPDFMSATEDGLLQSESADDYTYKTKVTHGQLETIREYNHLHLPLKSWSNTTDGTTSPVNTVEHIYTGTNGTNKFPPYDQLPTNYQMPSKVSATTFSNNAGYTRTRHSEATYNNYGQIEAQKVYRTDSSGNVVQVSNKTCTYDSRYGLMTELSITDEISGTTTSKEMTLDSTGKFLQSEVVKDGGGNGFKQIAYAYDSLSRIKSKTLSWLSDHKDDGPASSTERYSYSQSGTSITITHTDSQGNTSSREVDVRNGWTSKTTDALGNATSYTRDNLGRVTLVTYPDKSTLQQTYEEGVTVNDIYGGSVTANKQTTIHDNGYEQYVYYDGLHRVIRQADNLGSGGSERILLRSNEYNHLGKLSASTNAFGHTTTHSYDAQGRLTNTEDFLGNEQTRSYENACDYSEYPAVLGKTQSGFNGVTLSEQYHDDQGHPIVSVSTQYASSHNTSTATYNGYSQVVSADEMGGLMQADYEYYVNGTGKSMAYQGGDISGGHSWTRDLFNNTWQVNSYQTNGSGSKQSYSSERFTRNDIDLLVAVKDQAGSTEEREYTADGSLKWLKDLSGQEFNYEYDNMGRLTKCDYKTGHWPARKKYELNCAYDQYGFLTSLEDTKDGDTQSRISYEYTLNGLLTKQTYLDGTVLSWSYDEYDRVKTFTDAADMVTTYTYDNTTERLSSVSNGLGSVSYSYYAKDDSGADPTWSGSLKSKSYSNGVVITYIYDGNKGRIKSITAKNGSTVLSSYTHEYNDKHQLSTVTKASDTDTTLNGNHVTRYGYDGVDRLVSEAVYADASATEAEQAGSYVYDARGNITQRTLQFKEQADQVSTYEYNELNQLTSLDGKSFTYDDNGNMTGDAEGNQYVYDALDRLTEFHPDSGAVVYYDYYADGSRCSKRTSDSDRITFYYDHSEYKQIVNEAQDGSYVSYLMSGSERIARKHDDEVEFFITDGKSVTSLASASAAQEDSYEYTPYGLQIDLAAGELKPADNTMPDLSFNPFRYNGEYLDPESGLIYLRKRYYSPGLMRFITKDSLYTANRYAFASGNPVSRVDPGGDSDFGHWFYHSLAGTIVHGIIDLATALGGIASGNVTMVAGVVFDVASWINLEAKGPQWVSETFDIAGLVVSVGGGIIEGAVVSASRGVFSSGYRSYFMRAFSVDRQQKFDINRILRAVRAYGRQEEQVTFTRRCIHANRAALYNVVPRAEIWLETAQNELEKSSKKLIALFKRLIKQDKIDTIRYGFFHSSYEINTRSISELLETSLGREAYAKLNLKSYIGDASVPASEGTLLDAITNKEIPEGSKVYGHRLGNKEFGHWISEDSYKLLMNNGSPFCAICGARVQTFTGQYIQSILHYVGG